MGTLLLVVGGAVAVASADQGGSKPSARSPHSDAASFSVYTAGLNTGKPTPLSELVTAKLRDDPEARSTVITVLAGMLSKLREGQSVRVPGASTHSEAITQVQSALEIALKAA
jgi:hypothetical protein